MGYDCSISKRKGCNYCLKNKPLNTFGDDFSIFKNDDNKHVLCTEDKSFKILQINYCPVCGRKL